MTFYRPQCWHDTPEGWALIERAAGHRNRRFRDVARLAQEELAD
jgi:hypothetical protein